MVFALHPCAKLNQTQSIPTRHSGYKNLKNLYVIEIEKILLLETYIYLL